MNDYELPADLQIRDPEDVTPQMSKATLAEILTMAGNKSPEAVSIAYVYPRKREYSSDNLGDKPNTSYRGYNEDVVIQVTYRVGSNDRVLYERIAAAQEEVATHKAEAEAEVAEAELVRATAELEATRAELEERTRVANAKLAEAQAKVDKMKAEQAKR